MSNTPVNSGDKFTAEEYVEHGGAMCPVCGSYNIESGSYDRDGDWVAFNVKCNDCHSTWKDIHGLVKIDGLKRGGKR